MKNIYLFCVLYFVTNILQAQNLSFVGALPAYSQTGRISKKINYNIFVSTTIDAFAKTVNNVYYPATDFQLYIQPSLIYVHNNNLNFAVSYTYQRNNPFESNFTNERRLWQQAIFSHNIESGRMTHRVRLEERFFESRIDDSYTFATRARYQIGYNTPLQGKTLDIGEFYFNTYNEFYFSLTGVKNATYSENWTYAGTGYNFGKMGRVELGYLLQTGVRNVQKDLRFLHLAQIMWITNFNFFVKRK